MDHFALTELVWLESFGVLEPFEESLVRGHLDEGCSTCRAIAIRAARLAAREREEPRSALSLAELHHRVLASIRERRDAD